MTFLLGTSHHCVAEYPSYNLKDKRVNRKLDLQVCFVSSRARPSSAHLSDRIIPPVSIA